VIGSDGASYDADPLIPSSPDSVVIGEYGRKTDTTPTTWLVRSVTPLVRARGVDEDVALLEHRDLVVHRDVLDLPGNDGEVV
jgi:hypothetical protein